MSDQVTTVAIDNIMLSKTNPRSKLSQGNINELKESIREHGVIKHLLLRPLVGDKYELVDGERRYRVCKDLGLSEVPAIIRSLTDIEVLEIQLIDSLHKKDIHPLDECYGFQQLIDIKNYSVQQIAEKVSKPVSYVSQRLSFQQLINPVRKAFEENKILVGHVILLARMQEYDQEELFKWLYVYGDQYHTVNQLKEQIQNKFMTNLNNAGFNKNDETLISTAGSCKDCPKRTGYNEELFNDISSKDICTDSKCFEKKLQAHIAREVKKAEVEGEKIVKVSSQHYVGSGSKLLTKSDYQVVKGKGAKDENVKKAIIVHGEHRGKVMSVIVKEDAKATKMQTSQSKKKSEVETKNEEIKLQRRTRANNLILDAMLDNIKAERKPIVLDDFEMDRIMYCMCDNEAETDEVLKRHGWITKAKQWVNTDEFFKIVNKNLKEIKSAKVDGLFVLLMIELSWSGQLECVSYNQTNGTDLRKAAIDQYGVDIASIDKEVAEELPYLKEEKKEKKLKSAKKKAA